MAPSTSGRSPPRTLETIPLSIQSNPIEAEHPLDSSNCRRASGTLYPLPTNETELARQSVLHALYRCTLRGRLYLAPAENPLTVIDLGAGGNWADDFAIAHPNAVVYGTGLTHIQIMKEWGIHFFQVNDFEREWTCRSQFDFVFGRDLLPAVSNWPRLLEQAFKHIAPSGYIELQHQVLPLGCDESPTGLDRELIGWSEKLVEGFAHRQCTTQPDAAAEIEDLLKKTGFLDVHRQRFRWDLRARTNDQRAETFSQDVRKNLLAELDTYSKRLFLEDLGQSHPQHGVSLMAIRRAIENEATCVYIPVDVLYAKKPSLDDASLRFIAEDQQTKQIKYRQTEHPTQQVKLYTKHHEQHKSMHSGAFTGPKKPGYELRKADAIITKAKSLSNPTNLTQNWPSDSESPVTESPITPVRSVLPSEVFPLSPNPHSGYRSILWCSFLNDDQLFAKCTNALLVQYLAVDVAVQYGLTIEDAEKSLQEWTSLGQFWRIIQEWIQEYKKDTMNPAYRMIKEMAKEIRADGLEFLKSCHAQISDTGSLDLTYWTIRLHLSTDVNWYVGGTVAHLYSWRMLSLVDAELHLGNEEQRWTVEVDLSGHPFESLRDRGVIAPPLEFLATDPNVSVHRVKVIQ